MSDERMSRRARRAHEEDLEAAAESGAFAPAQPLGSEAAIPEQEEAALSRRDRRRLERVNNPVEAWTAEEEMLATGQIPTVTPQVIAEQEQARAKAAQIQAEAAAASLEIRRVSATDVDPGRIAAVTGSTAVAPPAPGEAPAPEAARPPTIQNLFPPGSLQARAFAEQAEQAAAAERTTQASQLPVEPLEPLGGDAAAEEIRQLTAAAMANMQRTGAPQSGPTPQASSAPSWEDQLKPTTGSYAIPGLAAAEPAPTLPGTGGIPRIYDELLPTRTPQSGSFPAIAPQSGSIPGLTPQSGAIPQPGAFPASGPIPQSVGSVIPALPPQPTPTQSAPSPWEAHPLDQVPPQQFNVNSYAPAQNVPTPDFSAILGGQAGTFSPTGPSTGGVANPFAPSGAPPMTGSIPRIPTPDDATTVQRRAADLQPAGGARHFKWAHFAVLFALMFVLGVVVFQVYRLNS